MCVCVCVCVMFSHTYSAHQTMLVCDECELQTDSQNFCWGVEELLRSKNAPSAYGWRVQSSDTACPLWPCTPRQRCVSELWRKKTKKKKKKEEEERRRRRRRRRRREEEKKKKKKKKRASLSVCVRVCVQVRVHLQNPPQVPAD